MTHLIEQQLRSQTVLPTVGFSPATTVVFTTAANNKCGGPVYIQTTGCPGRFLLAVALLNGSAVHGVLPPPPWASTDC
jgi:hypothetical protein